MAKSQEQIIADQAQDIIRLKQAVTRMDHMLRQLDRKAARANDGVRRVRNDIENIKRVVNVRGG